MIVLILLTLALALIGAGLMIAGIYLLMGLAWALVAGGLACITAAALLRQGLTHG